MCITPSPNPSPFGKGEGNQKTFSVSPSPFIGGGGRGEGVVVSIQQVPGTVDLPLPSYETTGAAGMDVRAAVDSDVVLMPGARVLIPTGVRIALPGGYEAQIRPRSGLALTHGVTLLNSPGTIDSDYRGVIQVILINLGQEPYTVKRGDRVAQMIVAPVVRVHWETADSLPVTVRNNGGFGHTDGNNGVGQ